MDSREIEQYLIDFQKTAFPELMPRSLSIPPSRKISAIIGPRRAGKSTYLFQMMKQSLAAGIKKENIIYLNLESTKLAGLTFKDLADMPLLQQKLFSSSSKQLLFLDEPQNVSSWEKAVRELHDAGHSLVVTGSSSKLLSKEIASSLRGRCLSYLLLPFSFPEFIRFQKLDVSGQVSSHEKSKILFLLQQYLEWGGFPEVWQEESDGQRLKIIESYFDLVVYRDIIERHHLKDTLLIRWFLKSLAASYAKEVSVHKLYLQLKSEGRTSSKDELYTLAAAANDALFLLFLPKFSWSIRKRDPVHKTYLCDVGYASLFGVGNELGKRMENVVFLHLYRKSRPLVELAFWKNVQQEEVDFVVREKSKIVQLIQVCYGFKEPSTKQREIRALIKAGKELHCRNLLIITHDIEGEEIVEWFGDKATVRYQPLWKWLRGE